ncbi:baseplate J/gp47 family protein [Grimontia marina]|uniref:Baseplate J-like protein n=1 Tax=Grimontia marina TaxID=646534 RepID=A0A128FC77_9GAMM|nr:baseplate J/gp47 family protein [Grimontia marina]CZF83881.1 Baseplate J-like protein [Grimontia marina]
MPYNPPTLAESIQQIEGDISLELGLNAHLPVVCSERAIAFSVGAAKRDLHDQLQWLAKQIVPTAESDDSTIETRAAYEGVPRKLPQKAKGHATFTVSDNAQLPLDSVLTAANGSRYLVTFATLPDNGIIIAAIEAELAGKAGNLNAGDVLTLVSPVPGIHNQATVRTLEGGVDIEPITELLRRLWFRKQYPPMGGALHDYRAWATEVPSVTRAWAYDAWQGGSTVGLTFVCDGNDDLLPSAAKIQEVKDYIYRHSDPATGVEVGRPAGIETVLFTLRIKPVQLAITLTPDTAETRAAVIAQLTQLERQFASPGSRILLSQVRTAIGTASGVMDYATPLASDIISQSNELITFEVPQWIE